MIIFSFEDLKTVHSDLKAKYDAVKSSHETQRNDVERSVTGMRGEMTGHETRLFQLQNQIKVRVLAMFVFQIISKLSNPAI